MVNKYVYSGLVLVLIVYLFFAAWQLHQVEAPPELPLTQTAAEDMGEELIRVSFPHMFHQETEGCTLDTKTTTIDKGDAWEVIVSHEPHIIKMRMGKKIRAKYTSNYVVLDKATGDVVRFGFYE